MPHPRRYPSDAELYRLYIIEDLSAHDIVERYGGGDQSGFYKLLRKAGIEVKKGNHIICIEDGCNEPVYRITHTNNGSKYGKRCREHKKQHYSKLSRDLQRRQRAITPDRYKPWQRKDDDLTDYEKETLWIVQSKKKLKEVNRYLRHKEPREV